MIDICSSHNDTLALELTDPDLEHGRALDVFLDLVIGEDVDYETRQPPKIVWLAKKYECSNLLYRIELGVYRSVHSTSNHHHEFFEVAAALEAWALCGHLISAGDDDVILLNSLCPGSWTPSVVDHHLRHGSLYLWGLIQSYSSSCNSRGELDQKMMGNLFTELMLEGR